VRETRSSPSWPAPEPLARGCLSGPVAACCCHRWRRRSPSQSLPPQSRHRGSAERGEELSYVYRARQQMQVYAWRYAGETAYELNWVVPPTPHHAYAASASITLMSGSRLTLRHDDKDGTKSAIGAPAVTTSVPIHEIPACSSKLFCRLHVLAPTCARYHDSPLRATTDHTI